MKILVYIALFFTFGANAQLISGDVITEGRQLISKSSFKITGSKAGEVYFELAVDRMGNVTSQRLMTEKTTITSTPTRMKAQEYVSELKFEPGTIYPHFQNVVVKVTVVVLPPAKKAP